MLFVGIDPGTTVAYAIYDTSNASITTHSQKELSSDLLVQKLSKYKITLVATDKAKVPEFVRIIAVKLGAMLYVPNDDMLVDDKIALTRNYATANSHERDAAASALFAASQLKNKFAEISKFLRENNLEEINESFIDKVLKNPTLSYKHILKQFLEMNKKLSDEKEAYEDDSANASTIASNDNVDSKSAIIRNLEKHNLALSKQNSYLKEELNAMRKFLDRSPKVPQQKSDKSLMEIIILKEKRLQNILKSIKSFEERLNSKTKEIERLIWYLKNNEEFMVIPFVNDLKSFPNLSKKVCFVQDANIYASAVIEKLTSEHVVISSMPANSKLKKAVQSTILNWDNLFCQKIRDIAIIRKSDFAKKLSSVKNVYDIINEYRESRKKELSEL